MFKRIIAMAVVSVALAACGGTAQAQPIIIQDTNSLYTLDNARAVLPYTSDQIIVARDNGALDYLPANRYNTIRNKVVGAKFGWVELYGAQILVDPGKAVRITCTDGVLTMHWWMTSPQTFPDPACGVYNQIKAGAI